MASQFKLPIMYNDSTRKVESNILDNLELSTQYKNIYGKTQNNFNLQNWCLHFTYDTDFLKDQQLFLNQLMTKNTIKKHKCMESYYDEWKKIMSNESVRETYYYIDWDHLDFVNYKQNIMLGLSIYNLSSPILTLLTPIICLLVPFFILKFIMKTDVTFDVYKELFFHYTKNNLFGKMIQNIFNPENINQQVTGFTMCMFYFMSLYQNTLVCIKFYQNMYFMKSYIQKAKMLFKNTIDCLDCVLSVSQSKQSFYAFNQHCVDTKTNIANILKLCENINEKDFNVFDIHQIGKYMALFYKLRYDTNIQQKFQYSFEFQEYILNLRHLFEHIKERKITNCDFTEKTTSLKSSYYLGHIYDKCIRNTIKIRKNLILTGPNASGKTTLIKSVMINLLLSQQIGYGCYAKNTKIHVYHSFYSYLNIPDTSDRDSLFQAEARRCLNIIKSLEKNKQERSFLIFDELYSGTNPTEATLSAISFMNYISQLKVHFMITTHYYDICTSAYLSKNIKNVHMLTESKNNDFEYKYKIAKGPSFKQGGIAILKHMGYPQAIINQIMNMETR